jgi:hypothetical protein
MFATSCEQEERGFERIRSFGRHVNNAQHEMDRAQPLLKAAIGGTTGRVLVSCSAFHRQPVQSTKAVAIGVEEVGAVGHAVVGRIVTLGAEA